MSWRSRRRKCALSTCNDPVYTDTLTGQEHDFCGKTHASLYEQQHQRALRYQADQQQHQAATIRRRATGGNVLWGQLVQSMSMIMPSAHRSNSKPSAPPASIANGASPPAQQKLPVNRHAPIARQQAMRTRYCTAEQYMMACKANVFGDKEAWQAIMKTSDPAEQKRLGKEVANFDYAVWSQFKVQFVLTGNYSKFTQNPEMCDQLLATGDKMLAEASPRDNVWGIGMDANDPNVERPECWRGQNLLGKTLMYVRTKIRWERPDLAGRPQVKEIADAMEMEYDLIPSTIDSGSAAGSAMTAASLGAHTTTAVQAQLPSPDMAFPRQPVMDPPDKGEPAPEVEPIAKTMAQQNKADTKTETPGIDTNAEPPGK